MTNANGYILVVDDDPVLCELMERLLIKQNYQVDIARNAKEALDKLEHRSFDLIITDLQMPGMDGLSLLDKIKERTHNTPVIMVTAHGSMEIVIQALRRGANDFVNKPFQAEELINIVNREVARKQEQDPVGTNENLNLDITEDQLDIIDRQLAELRAQTSARCVLLLEGNGYAIDAKGVIEEINLPALSALVAGEAAATSSIANLIGEGDTFQLNYHEGERYSIYSAQVVRSIFLLTIFGQEAKSGMVLYYTKQVLSQLRPILEEAQKSASHATAPTRSGNQTLQQLDQDMLSAIDEQFDDLWE